VSTRFRIDDHVSWNTDAGRVSGRIVEVHASDSTTQTTTTPHPTTRSTRSSAIAANTSPAWRHGPAQTANV